MCWYRDWVRFKAPCVLLRTWIQIKWGQVDQPGHASGHQLRAHDRPPISGATISHALHTMLAWTGLLLGVIYLQLSNLTKPVFIEAAVPIRD